jgi:zinc/manganese transport system substrate-binding protein
MQVARTRSALLATDPPLEANAAAYLRRLDALETEVKAILATIPLERRKLITSHDAFGYFGKAYGIEFIADRR